LKRCNKCVCGEPCERSLAHPLVDCEFSAVSQSGEVIIRGDATAVL
jgi:hypothetical protein